MQSAESVCAIELLAGIVHTDFFCICILFRVAHKYILMLQWACVLGAPATCAKTAEPIEMLIGGGSGRLLWAQETLNYIDEVHADPHGEEHVPIPNCFRFSKRCNRYKVKFSYTRYQALGPKLTPVYIWDHTV